MRTTFTKSIAAATMGAALVASLGAAPASARNHRAAAPAALPTFKMSVFARGNKALFNPDGIVVTKTNVYVDYQNSSDTTPAPSIVAKYDRNGKLLMTVKLDGRSDGLRLNPYTNVLWALVNNDGRNGSPPRQPKLYTIDPASLKATLYTFPATSPHGGGYDDIAFQGGNAYFSASSPTLNGGINDKPIVAEAVLQGSNVVLKSVVNGNVMGLDITSGKVMQLNITDPDSMAVDNKNNVVLVSEGDAQVVFLGNAGGMPTVARLGTGTQLDDIIFPTGTSGTFWVADTTLNVIYAIKATYAAGTVFSEAAQGAPVQSAVGIVDPKTGIFTPLLTELDGIVNPTSLVFVPNGG